MEGDGRGDGRGGGSGIETGGPRVIFARAILIVIPRFYSAHLGAVTLIGANARTIGIEPPSRRVACSLTSAHLCRLARLYVNRANVGRTYVTYH
jgi:hypothetical protein